MRFRIVADQGDREVEVYRFYEFWQVCNPSLRVFGPLGPFDL